MTKDQQPSQGDVERVAFELAKRRRSWPGTILDSDREDARAAIAALHSTSEGRVDTVCVRAVPDGPEAADHIEKLEAELLKATGVLDWTVEQARNGMSIAAGCATTHGDDGGGLEMLHSILSDLEVNAGMALDALAAATQRAKTLQAAECEASQSGPKGNAHTSGHTSGSGRRSNR